MRILTLLVASLLIVSAVAFFAAAPGSQAATVDKTGQLVEYAGPTNALGGGSAVLVSFGTDAAFGVVYGNSTHANNVYVVAIKARYLGVGQIYNLQGQKIATNQTIKIYTIYAAQLRDIIEYNDVNHNNIADYNTTYNATADNFTVNPTGSDLFFKKVSLNTNWNVTTVNSTSGTGYRTWTFGLTATNLSYENISSNAKLTGALPKVQFTFHLNASVEQTDNVNVPDWNVTVGTLGSRYYVADVHRLADLTLANATYVHYDVKWDQLIEGWTYANNNHAPYRRLLLTVGNLVTNYIPYTVTEGWIQARLVDKMGEDGQASYNYTSGSSTVGASANNTTGAYGTPREFQSPNVDFGGNWSRIGQYLWASNATVDTLNTTVYAQILGGWGFRATDARGDVFSGFLLLTGLNFVGGTTILHDPTMTSDVIVDTNLPAAPSTTPPPTTPPPAGYGALVVGIVLLLVLVLVAYALIVRNRKKPEPPEQPPAEPPTQPPEPPQT